MAAQVDPLPAAERLSAWSSTPLADAGDAELVEAIAHRGDDALAEIYRRHASHVAWVADAVLRNRASAEDVAQEVFVRLWCNPQKFDPGRGSLRTYLATMAHARAVDLFRAERSRCRRQDRHLDTVAPAAGVDDHAVASSIGAALRAGVAALPLGERDAVTLAYFSAYTYRQVATILEVPEGTVKSRIRSGLRRLRPVALSQAVVHPS
ncbi:MAG: sigma-70 family RNA polymerase sigma factor [Actinobacteria bacterium]|nr:sigma-70 family RNA polymerase sigma factor [Actinomycetota bacterium]